jgi:alpha-mannosidase
MRASAGTTHTEDELGFELGVRRRFEQALLPHAGDWRGAALPRAGAEFNAPLIVRKLDGHDGSLPPSRGFVDVAPANVALHALHIRGDELVLRVSEMGGAATDAEVRLAWPVAAVRETDLAGAAGAPVTARGDGLAFTLRPFEIRTYAISLSR